MADPRQNLLGKIAGRERPLASIALQGRVASAFSAIVAQYRLEPLTVVR
jgi:hypothetical protein